MLFVGGFGYGWGRWERNKKTGGIQFNPNCEKVPNVKAAV
jgi:hypothetical protein